MLRIPPDTAIREPFNPQAFRRQPFLVKLRTVFLCLFFPHIQILGMQQKISVMQNSVGYKYDLGVYNHL